MKNILVSIDLNNDEHLLIEEAINLALPFQSKIWLLYVAYPEPDWVGYGVGPQYIENNQVLELKKEHKQLEKFSKEIRAKGLESESLLIQGPTTDLILKEAKNRAIDIIITGHHQHNIFYTMFFGSVSKSLINKSEIPVLVIPLDS